MRIEWQINSKKSVLERLEQENNRQKRSSRKGINETSLSVPEAKEELPAPIDMEFSVSPQEPVTVDVPVAKTGSAAIPDMNPVQPDQDFSAADISRYIRREPQRMAKNKTFYLDGDVIDAIKKTARTQKITDSKLVNDILRQVLGIRQG